MNSEDARGWHKSRRLFSRFLWPLLFVGLFLCLSCLRYRAGAHYRQVTVTFPQATAQQLQGGRVWIVSPFGSTRELRTHVGRPGYFFEADHLVSSPMTAIAVFLPSVPQLQPWVELRSSQPDWAEVLGQLQADDAAPCPSGLPAGCAIYRPAAGRSLLPGLPRKCFNWSGDAVFIGVVLLQSLFTVLLGRCLLAVTALIARTGSPVPGRGFFSWQGLLGGSARVLAIAVLVLQGWSLAGDLIRTPGSPVVLISLLAINAVAWLLLQLLQGRSIVGVDWLLRHPGLVVGVLLVLRLLVAGAWPWYQTGDYRLYLYNGRCMLNGEWDQMSRSTVFDPLFIERSLFYGTVSAFCASILPYGDVLLHVSVLALTLWLLWRATVTVSGRETALLAVVFFMLYPDIFFGAHLCRHENPFLLVLAGAALLLPCLGKLIDRSTVSLRHVPMLCAAAVMLGLLTAFLEIQRRHGIFLFGTAVVGLFSLPAVCGDVRARQFTLRRLLLTGTCCLIVLLVSRSGADAVRDFIVQKCGPLRAFGAVDYIASSETDSPRASTSAENMDWLEYYASGMPDEFRRELNLRKIAFDKSDVPLTLQVFVRKNDWLGKVEFPILQSAGIVPDEHTVSSWFSPWRTGKLIFANGFVLLLLGAWVARLWDWDRCRPTPAEWVLAVYSGLLVTAIVVFGNSEMQYDQCVAFPLAISLAGLVGRGQRWNAAPSSGTTVSAGTDTGSVDSFGVPSWLTCGTAGLLLLLSVWAVISSVLQMFPALTFAAPVQYQAADDRGSMDFSRQSLCLISSAQSGAAGGAVHGIAVFRRADFCSDQLRFVLSLDQRRRGVAAATEDAGGDYRCVVEGKTVASGKLTDLASRCRAITVPLQSAALTFNVELVIEAIDGPTAQRLPIRLAAEFFH
ncbi:MAG: hypothetical protein ACKO3T_11515 [Planctomycetaceae bacterium]